MDLTDICIPLSCSVKLPNPLDAKALHELPPDLWPKPIAEGCTNTVLVLGRSVWLRKQVATQLTNVLRHLKQKDDK